MQEYDDDGILKLAVAVVESAKEECMACVTCGDFIAARIIADRDSRGLVGWICEWACGNRNAILDEVNEVIKNIQSTEEEEWWYNNGRR